MTVQDKVYDALLESPHDVAGWRDHARNAIALDIAPEQICWHVSGDTPELDLYPKSPLPGASGEKQLSVSKSLLSTLTTALLHKDTERFALAYRILWRSRAQPKLHLNPADADIKQLNELAKSVRRDIHKMHAFVRFRKTGEVNGREQFIAWFEPDHHITHAVAAFFRNRFTGMDWIIVTQEASIAWDGRQLSYGPGGSKKDVPQDDSIEAEWRTYYASIFNPARVKVQAMKSEMPVKYWKNLPEAELIPSLIEQSAAQTDAMLSNKAERLDLLSTADEMARQMPASLDELYDRLRSADDAPTAGFSNRIVAGEGPADANIMFVGEQPGDVEDMEGRPFVGPAGQLLDRAMASANIERSSVYLTNAVKRFKFEQRGERRIHRTPLASETDYYRWWVKQEIALVRPKLVIALGATAARSLTSKSVTISRIRGSIMPLTQATNFLVTVHPSFLLRIPDKAGQQIEYDKFIRDLKLAKDYENKIGA